MIEKLYKKYIESTGVSTDSRNLHGGELFFTLKGESFDGNRFVEKALESGCSYVVADDASLPSHPKVLLVKDALQTLQQLASYHRKRWNGRVLAITGSNGKTTTKELTALVLAKKYRVLATSGNLNNHIGVPLTLLKLKDEELAVIEMGANHPGEIAVLCEIAAPDAGLITNIGKAHLEGFGSIEGVEEAKGELYAYLSENDGVVLVNTAVPRLKELAARKQVKTFYYGYSNEAEISGSLDRKDTCIEGSFSVAGSSYRLNSALFGEYNFMNILSATAAGVYFDVDPGDISEAIKNYLPDNNRSQIIQGKTNTIILDAYNANPSSMSLALSDFIQRKELQKMVILGDMYELGAESFSEHEAILMKLKEADIQEIILVGRSFHQFAQDERFPFRFFIALEDCMSYLTALDPVNFLILLKGSRKNSLEKTTKLLIDC